MHCTLTGRDTTNCDQSERDQISIGHGLYGAAHTELV